MYRRRHKFKGKKARKGGNLPPFYLFPPICKNLANTPTKPAIMPKISTYGQYFVKIVVARETVVLIMTVMILSSVSVAVGKPSAFAPYADKTKPNIAITPTVYLFLQRKE